VKAKDFFSAWLILLSVFLPHRTFGQEIYRFELEVRNVYVDVFVTRDGKPVTDLESKDFVVFDNGVAQEHELVDIEAVPMSTLLVLDVSGSVRGPKLKHLRRAAHAFVEGLKDDDEAGLLMFTHQMDLRKGLDNDFTTLQEVLNQSIKGGYTALNDALFAGLKLLESGTGRPLLLLFTDGDDNASWIRESDLLDAAKASDAVIYTVGVVSSGGVYSGNRLVTATTTRDASRFLERLAESTGGRTWFARSADELEDIYLRILSEMETRFLLTYQPRDVSREGWHKIEVKVSGHKASEVRARSGYLVVTP
jgi:VWFA-related protein